MSRQRQRLPDSVFCGPNRTFPCHDATHVRLALAMLPNVKYDRETKLTILKHILKKAKMFGVDVPKNYYKTWKELDIHSKETVIFT